MFPTLTILTTLTALTLSAPSAKIETLDGVRFTGQLRALSSENTQIETPEGLKNVATDRLISVTFPQNHQAPTQANQLKGKLLVTLADGSHIVANDYRVHNQTAELSITDDPQKLTIPTRDVEAVRFASATPSLKEAWQQLKEDGTHSDRLIVAKSGSLDYHDGTLGDITDSRIVFSLDGDPLKVKRKKVFGVTYYHPAGRDLPNSLGRLETSTGSSWPFVAVTLEEDGFQLKTPVDLDLFVPLEQVHCIHFAEGKIAYLSDMPPESIAWTPYLTIKTPTNSDDNEARATLFGPKFNRSFQAGPLVLGGKHYPKGLAIHSRSVITYRLDKKYGRLTAMAGIADRVRPRGNVQLIISADDRVLLDREISGTEEAIPIDLDLNQADRLTITVDFGRQTDIADRLILGDAKVME